VPHILIFSFVPRATKGRDTTACALSWTWYELTRHPEIVVNIVDEVRNICGVGDEADFSFDTMNQLKYTHCVALEVLRLHPPVTNDPRYAKRDSRLPDGTFTAKGLGVDMCFYAMGRKEDIWGSDALQFKPERFLNEKEPSTFKFPAFNAGPRMCLGKPLALMNIKLTMAILLTSGLQLDDKEGHSGDYLWNVVQSMKGGFPIHVSSSSP
jgi:cytochrome P450